MHSKVSTILNAKVYVLARKNKFWRGRLGNNYVTVFGTFVLDL